MATLQRYPADQKFVEIALSSTVFEIKALMCFAIFAKNSKIQNGRHFFENWDGHSAEIPWGSKILSKSLYLARFSTYKIFVFCNLCKKFENSKWPPFLVRQNFWKNVLLNLQRYPVDQKFCRNHPI